MYRYVKRSSDLEEQAKEPAAVQALLVERRPVARVESGGLGSSSHDVDTFCKGSSRIVLRLGLPPKGDSKQIPTIFAIVRPHVLFLGSTLIGADLIAAKAIV